MDYWNSAFFVDCLVFLELFNKYYLKLNWHNLDMTGHTSNTTLTNILYLKMVLPVHESYVFTYLISRYLLCSFHDKFSSNMTPRNLIVSTLLITWLFVFSVSKGEGMLYFLSDLWNNENLVFPALSGSLLSENHSLVDLKVRLSPSKKNLCYFLHWNFFKNDVKCFVFHLKSLFCSEDVYVFVMTFWPKTVWLDRQD